LADLSQANEDRLTAAGCTSNQPRSMTYTLISGISQLMLSNGVARLLSIFTMPILTRLLSPHAYGVTALAGTVISLASVFALAGIDMSYARAYPSAQPPSGADVEHYCWRFAISGALLASVVGTLAWWFFNRDSMDQDRRLAILIALGIIFSVANTMALTRARLAVRYGAIALTLTAAGIIGVTASVGIAAIWRRDALALLIPMLLGYLIPVLLLGTPSIAGLAKPSGLTRKEGAVLIKIGLAGVVTAPLYWLLSSSDRWFLQYYQGAEAVGVYSIGYSVGIVGMMINGAVITVWLPEAAREYEEDPERARVTLGRLMSRILVVMALIWLAVAAAGGDIVRWLANERFHDAADYVPYIAGGVFFYGVLRLADTGLLIAKQLNWAALWWLAGAVVCSLLNIALVPRYGGLGAAITQSIGFAFMSIGIFSTAQTKFSLCLDWSRLAIVVAIILTAGLFMIPPWHATAPIISLLMKLPFGIVVAAISVWITAPDWCARAIEYLLREGTVYDRLSHMLALFRN
jgi:O-antigen/teichoic acid export membrane protein